MRKRRRIVLVVRSPRFHVSGFLINFFFYIDGLRSSHRVVVVVRLGFLLHYASCLLGGFAGCKCGFGWRRRAGKGQARPLPYARVWDTFVAERVWFRVLFGKNTN